MALALQFLNSAMPYVPLWSSIMENPMRYAKDELPPRDMEFFGWHEAFAECFFCTLNHDIFSVCLLPVVVQDFVRITQTSLTGQNIP